MMRKRVGVVAAGLVAAVAVAVAPVTRAATGPSGSVAPGADPADPGLLLSSTPKTVVLDPATGAVVSVTLGEPAPLSVAAPAISGGTDCGSGDGCYYTPVVNSTYHDRSFQGSAGTFTGSWPRRNAWGSGSYTASVCWDGGCSRVFGPNSYVTFGGSLVTGTSFTIY